MYMYTLLIYKQSSTCSNACVAQVCQCYLFLPLACYWSLVILIDKCKPQFPDQYKNKIISSQFHLTSSCFSAIIQPPLQHGMIQEIWHALADFDHCFCFLFVEVLSYFQLWKIVEYLSVCKKPTVSHRMDSGDVSWPHIRIIRFPRNTHKWITMVVFLVEHCLKMVWGNPSFTYPLGWREIPALSITVTSIVSH